MFSTSNANSSPPRRAAESCGRSVPTQPFGNLFEQHIAGSVSEAVVDFLEAVEVEVKHAATVIGPARPAAEREGQAIKKESAIGEAGEHIVHGIMLQLGLSRPCPRRYRGS